MNLEIRYGSILRSFRHKPNFVRRGVAIIFQRWPRSDSHHLIETINRMQGIISVS